ncbi:hypothetical protein CCZ01_06945 [Helicobacter monodelphidis]|uniref:Uncharacterized protein n=1 Tax=Helicobacter didelphidarum TaxID=2040648 RepID=A0A3D8I6V7_9HELI|nr:MULTISPECIES: hypothetical protein [Helicobacter]RAX57195.1 hypothetical protein CCZ01_06945 [Helicobacter sp. 15-1451]RDU60857.1 hypothetical protein CQA53_10670 [Helicobacter didelphidarum]
MKNFFVILLLIAPISSLGRSYCYDETKAYSESISFERYRFTKDPVKYYKRWALMYCLGYTSNERKMHHMPKCKERKEIENPSHIDNMVKTCGIEPLEEIKTYLDKEYLPFDSLGKVNNCFYGVYENKEFQERLETIVSKHCK